MSVHPVPAEWPDDFLPVDAEPFATTEVRWFAVGEAPPPLIERFCDAVDAAGVEARRDTYRVGDSFAVGLKRRNGGLYELKLRGARTMEAELHGAPPGRVEEWRKLRSSNPVAGRDDDSVEWLDVDKLIRRQSYWISTGGGVASVDYGDATAPGCNAELTSLLLGTRRAWTFALEAWGPGNPRRRLFREVLAGFNRERPALFGFAPALELSMGYPEFLATVTWPEPTN